MARDEGMEKPALERAAMESLENLAFTEAAPGIVPDGFIRGGDCLAAVIPLDRGGELAIWMDRNLLTGVAATLFCIPPGEVGESVLGDALMEFLNIVAGRYMASDSRTERVLSLGLPKEMPQGLDWSRYPVTCYLKAEPSGCFSLGLKP